MLKFNNSYYHKFSTCYTRNCLYEKLKTWVPQCISIFIAYLEKWLNKYLISVWCLGYRFARGTSRSFIPYWRFFHWAMVKFCCNCCEFDRYYFCRCCTLRSNCCQYPKPTPKSYSESGNREVQIVGTFVDWREYFTIVTYVYLNRY